VQYKKREINCTVFAYSSPSPDARVLLDNQTHTHPQLKKLNRSIDRDLGTTIAVWRTREREKERQEGQERRGEPCKYEHKKSTILNQQKKEGGEKDYTT
jgi:hypothetical protein